MKRNKNDEYLHNASCDKCGSSDAVGVYRRESGEIYGYCFSCETVHNYQPGDIIITNTVKEESYKEYQVSGDYYPLKSRGISKGTCEKYGVMSRVNTDGDDISHYYQFKSNDNSNTYTCIRDVKTKGFSWVNSNKNLQLFGQELAGSNGKMLLITEGVCDCLAVSEMLAKLGKNYRVVSLVNGSGGAVRDVQNNYEWLNGFESIYLALDQDEPGQKAAKKIANLFTTNKVKALRFSENDPNDMLKAGKAQEFLSSIFNAKETRPDGIVSVEDIFDEAIKPPVKGLSFPWPTLTEATYGYRRKEVWGIGAGSGSGKTELFKEWIDHTINVHKLVAGVIFLEESASKTLKVLAGKKVNKRFHIPQDRGGNWEIQELVDGITDLKGKVYLYNHNGAKDWESIKAKIRYMAYALGIKDFYLDHLTALVAQEADEYRALNKIMEEIASLAEELDCTIFFISHLRNPGGTPHEEGGRVTVDQFKGSGAIRFWSHFLIGLERNQQAEDLEERNTTTLRVLKDRDTGLATGVTFKLVYHHDTGRWVEKDEDEFNESI